MAPTIKLIFALVALGCGSALASSPADDSSFEALTEGNRLFRDGQVESAVEVYTRGSEGVARRHPTLLYNLGAALHHLDRLPEAILWYRRAGSSNDPWLEENLFLARRSLGSQSMPPGGAWHWLVDCRKYLAPAAIVLAWLSVLIVFRSDKRLALTTVCVSGFLYGASLAIDYWGPHPAVVLVDCSTTVGDLPAGTEAWVRLSDEGQWTISGSRNTFCPPESIELLGR